MRLDSCSVVRNVQEVLSPLLVPYNAEVERNEQIKNSQ
jgi:hypothetical protein